MLTMPDGGHILSPSRWCGKKWAACWWPETRTCVSLRELMSVGTESSEWRLVTPPGTTGHRLPLTHLRDVSRVPETPGSPARRLREGAVGQVHAAVDTGMRPLGRAPGTGMWDTGGSRPWRELCELSDVRRRGAMPPSVRLLTRAPLEIAYLVTLSASLTPPHSRPQGCEWQWQYFPTERSGPGATT